MTRGWRGLALTRQRLENIESVRDNGVPKHRGGILSRMAEEGLLEWCGEVVGKPGTRPSIIDKWKLTKLGEQMCAEWDRRAKAYEDYLSKGTK